jgi:glycerol-3-phosphate acyltransferase PlsY
MGLPAAIAVIIACYALGCVLPSWYAVKWRTGSDLRETGTGTVGSTNAGRILGKQAYVILSLLDILKGWTAPAFAARFGLTGWWIAGAGLAVVAGHVWPLQLRFHGGKGLSAAYGVIIFTAPWTALLMWPVFGAAWLAFRSTTLGMVQALFSAPLLALATGASIETCSLLFILAAVVSLTHRRNIREALQSRRGERPTPSTESSAA